MKVLSTLLLLVVIALVVVGFYRGWFRISGADSANHSHITMSVDQAKIRSDKDKAIGKVQNMKPASNTSAPAVATSNSKNTSPDNTAVKN